MPERPLFKLVPAKENLYLEGSGRNVPVQPGDLETLRTGTDADIKDMLSQAHFRTAGGPGTSSDRQQLQEQAQRITCEDGWYEEAKAEDSGPPAMPDYCPKCHPSKPRPHSMTHRLRDKGTEFQKCSRMAHLFHIDLDQGGRRRLTLMGELDSDGKRSKTQEVYVQEADAWVPV